ncbi:hypothetical protein N3K66_006316 [Trichothecium roseum]|uniref:Uncharacterized protein n=1 Tax=Trichothecium roseum TaxID=47278 RepID=A0ACC0UV23_9HYPO|nr:hypothetical protein N3K66_006316 [Trichothecium roseum]
MSSTRLLFLYNTRTILHRTSPPSSPAWLANPASLQLRAYASPSFSRKPQRHHRTRNAAKVEAIPFDWGEEGPPPDMLSFSSDTSGPSSTITPGEAGIFEKIFGEIAQGKTKPGRKGKALSSPSTGRWVGPIRVKGRRGSTTFVSDMEEAASRARTSSGAVPYMSAFREQVLTRFPDSLRDAAQLALVSFDRSRTQAEEDKKNGDDGKAPQISEEVLERRARNDMKRAAEKQRVEVLMGACRTDIELWRVMEKEVFHLPVRLGLVQGVASNSNSGSSSAPSEPAKTDITDDGSSSSSSSNTAAAAATPTPAAENAIDPDLMELHGPLFSHFLVRGLRLFESRFDRTSPFAFHILPRVKALGLPAYVLGVTTTFYAALADAHWTRFGDAAAALDALQEMTNVGLPADDQVAELLVRMRKHIDAGLMGNQGEFVRAVAETSAYSGDVIYRLDAMLEDAAAAGDNRRHKAAQGLDRADSYGEREYVSYPPRDAMAAEYA